MPDSDEPGGLYFFRVKIIYGLQFIPNEMFCLTTPKLSAFKTTLWPWANSKRPVEGWIFVGINQVMSQEAPMQSASKSEAAQPPQIKSTNAFKTSLSLLITIKTKTQSFVVVHFMLRKSFISTKSHLGIVTVVVCGVMATLVQQDIEKLTIINCLNDHTNKTMTGQKNSPKKQGESHCTASLGLIP